MAAAASPAAPATVAGAPIDRRRQVLNLGLFVGLDFGLSLVIFFVAAAYGASDTAAYLLSSIGPGISLIVQAIVARRVDSVSLMFIAMLVLSAGVAFVGGDGDPTLLLLKDSALTGGFGLLCLLSMLRWAPRPLMYYFARKFATDGTPAAMGRWDERWHLDATFRAVVGTVTLVWGVGYLAEALVKVGSALTMSFDAAYLVDNLAPLLVTAALAAWTWAYARTRLHLHLFT